MLSNESETSAKLVAFLFFVPLKMIFSIFSDRNVRIFCSPNTHLIASTIFDLPQPFGPTTPVIPLSKLMVTLSPKLLNPLSSNLVNNICAFGGEFGQPERAKLKLFLVCSAQGRLSNYSSILFRISFRLLLIIHGY